MNAPQLRSFRSLIEKPGLKYSEHEELTRLVELWDNKVKDRCFHLGQQTRRRFVLTVVYVAGGHVPVIVGTVKECIAYLKGAIYGYAHMVNP